MGQGQWYFNSFLGMNPDKYQFMTIETPNTLLNFQFNNVTIKTSVSKKLLGAIIDKKTWPYVAAQTIFKKVNLNFMLWIESPYFCLQNKLY